MRTAVTATEATMTVMTEAPPEEAIETIQNLEQ